MYANRKNNDMAVSPIVATLVLIVVAVIGAVAVGTIMGTFSSDVSDQANAQGVAGASATEILTAGSTSVQPVSEELAKKFMKENPSIKITIQGGGSGAGISSAGLGIVDLGASSSESEIDAANVANPEWDLKKYKIGGSAVVVVMNSALAGTVINKTDLRTFYDTTAGVTLATGTTDVVGAATGVQRSDASGTEETFAKWLISSSTSNVDNALENTAASGNSGVLTAVKADTDAIGFLDMGFAYDASTGAIVPGIKILNIQDGANTYTTTKANMLTQVKSSSATTYPNGLVKGLFYVTKGEPNSVLKSYLQFAQSPAAHDYITAAGAFSNKDTGYAGVTEV